MNTSTKVWIFRREILTLENFLKTAKPLKLSGGKFLIHDPTIHDPAMHDLHVNVMARVKS